jgi:HAD superfamily hydrolase (TIGR01484 family)
MKQPRALERWENEGGEIPIEHRNLELVASAPQHARKTQGEKRLVVFDLDGTLAESKSSLDSEMAGLLRNLLDIVKVAVISGGNWPQFERQLLANLGHGPHLRGLSLLPTCGTQFFRYELGWKRLYAEDFSATEKTKIIGALKHVLDLSNLEAEETWGERIEDRGSQITFSALGQEAPSLAKKQWDPDFSRRRQLKSRLDQLIPEFSVHLGGSTSIDITKPGIDKAYGIEKLRETLGIGLDEMIFVGDALFPGGNDYPVKAAGVVSIQVSAPSETKRVIETIIACLASNPVRPVDFEAPK